MPGIGIYANNQVSPYGTNAYYVQTQNDKDGIDAGATLSGVKVLEGPAVINETPLQEDILTTISDEALKSNRPPFWQEEHINKIMVADEIFNRIAEKLNEQEDILALARNDEVFAKDELAEIFNDNTTAIAELRASLEAEMNTSSDIPDFVNEDVLLAVTATKTPEQVNFSDREAVIDLSVEVGNALEVLSNYKNDLQNIFENSSEGLKTEDLPKLSSIEEAQELAEELKAQLPQKTLDGVAIQAKVSADVLLYQLS